MPKINRSYVKNSIYFLQNISKAKDRTFAVEPRQRLIHYLQGSKAFVLDNGVPVQHVREYVFRSEYQELNAQAAALRAAQNSHASNSKAYLQAQLDILYVQAHIRRVDRAFTNLVAVTRKMLLSRENIYLLTDTRQYSDPKMLFALDRPSLCLAIQKAQGKAAGFENVANVLTKVCDVLPK